VSGFVDLIKKNIEDIDNDPNNEGLLEANVAFLLDEKTKVDAEIVRRLCEIDDPLTKALSFYLKWTLEAEKNFENIAKFFVNLTDAMKKYSTKEILSSWIFEIFVNKKVQFKLFDELENDIIVHQHYLDKTSGQLFVVQERILRVFSDAFIVLAKNGRLEKTRMIGSKIYVICSALEKKYVAEERYDLERYLIELRIGINKILAIDGEKGIRLRLAESYEDEGDSLGKKNTGFGLTSYAHAFMNYLDLGEKERLEKVKAKLKSSGKAMKQGLKPIQIGSFKVSSKEWTHSLIPLIKYHDVLESTINLSVIYPTMKAPTSEEIGIFIQLMPSVIIDDDGNVAAILEWSKDQEECRKYRAFNKLQFEELEYSRVRLQFFKFLTDIQLLSENDLQQVIYSAPIDEKLKERLKLGVNRHFLKDFKSSSYILTLQLEPLLVALANLKVNIVAISRKPKRQGATLETTLGTLLENDKVRELFGKDFYNLLQLYFTYDLGLNRRNEIAHGLVNHEKLTEEYSLTTLFFVFRMLFMLKEP